MTWHSLERWRAEIRAATWILAVFASVVTLSLGRSHRSPRDTIPGHALEAPAWLPPGVSIQIALTGPIDAGAARRGDRWSGVVTRAIGGPKGVLVPVGASASGIVAAAARGRDGGPVTLTLALRTVEASGLRIGVEDAVASIAPRPRSHTFSVETGVLIDFDSGQPLAMR